MWYEAEYTVMPAQIDNMSSSKFVYIRKDVECIEKENDKVFRCKEKRILKEDFDTYEKIIGHDIELSEVRDAVIELSEIVVGVWFMAKIFWRKYKDKVENGEMTVDEVVEIVPNRWKEEVRKLFDESK